MKNWKWLLGLLLVGNVTLISVVWGATYNFNMNNTEQGSNSTASPVLNISGDGKATSTGAQQTITNTENGKFISPQLTPAAPAPTGISQASASPEGQPRFEFRHWRLGLSGFDTRYSFSPDDKQEKVGAMLSLGMLFTPELGFNVFGGTTGRSDYRPWFAGGELEITPIRASLFRMENFLELAGLAGASSLKGLASLTGIAPHVGVRASLNLGYQIGVSIVARQLLGQGDFSQLVGEAGLIVHL